MLLRTLCTFGISVLAIALGGCGRPDSPEETCAAKLAPLVNQQLGSEQAPVKVITFLPVNNGCQDVIGEYLADVAREFPALFQVRIMDMKDPQAKDVMRAHGIHCAAVLINGKTTFDLGGEDGKFILEGPMDPRDIARALKAAAHEAVGDQAPELPRPPELPGIENMPKRMAP
jgi:hypothetical protein